MSKYLVLEMEKLRGQYHVEVIQKHLRTVKLRRSCDQYSSLSPHDCIIFKNLTAVTSQTKIKMSFAMHFSKKF